MEDGRVTQFGPTADIYRNPENIAAARVFSDPPINVARSHKQAHQAQLAGGGRLGTVTDMADGDYMVAVRPHRVTPVPHLGCADVELTGRVIVTELSGSDSSAHFQHGDVHGSRSPRACIPIRWARTTVLHEPGPLPVFRPRRQKGGLTWHRSSFQTCDTAISQRQRPRGLCAEGNRRDLARWRGLCAAGPVGLRQVHAAEHHLGPADAVRRADSVR